DFPKEAFDMKRVFLAAILVLVSTGAAFAQLGGGTLSGTITDQQGAVMPGVTVTLTGSDRTLTAVTDDAGQFRFLNLAPGQYKVTMALSGFANVVRDKIEVRVGATTDLPAVAMKVASVTEAVTVTGGSPIVDTKATGTATNFTSDELQKIPTSR